jgi:hypothetical protein
LIGCSRPLHRNVRALLPTPPYSEQALAKASKLMMQSVLIIPSMVSQVFDIAAAAQRLRASLAPQYMSRLTVPNVLSATPLARDPAMGMTCRMSRKTSMDTNTMFNASTVTMPAPRAAV